MLLVLFSVDSFMPGYQKAHSYIAHPHRPDKQISHAIFCPQIFRFLVIKQAGPTILDKK